MKSYTIVIDEKEFIINFTNKTKVAVKDLGLEVYPIYGTLLLLGKELLKLEHKQQFIVIDDFQRIGIIGYRDTCTSAIDIVCVVHKDNIRVLDSGTKVINYK